jgi:hypothetical protein
LPRPNQRKHNKALLLCDFGGTAHGQSKNAYAKVGRSVAISYLVAMAGGALAFGLAMNLV